MTNNPFLSRPKKCAGTRAEQKTAKRLGAVTTPASGALDGAKSDMVLNDFRIENKSTVHESIAVQLDWLLKIQQEALEKNQVPAVSIQFTMPDGTPRKEGAWVMMTEFTFRELIK